MQIKFKAITTKGKWVEGDEISDGNNVFINQNNTMSVKYKSKEDESLKRVYELYHCVEVIPETVCQFTGKHIAGKDLFQGDVVRTINHYEGKNPYFIYHKILWSERLCGWFAKNIGNPEDEEKSGDVQLWTYLKNLTDYHKAEITGSIHDKHLKDG